MKKLLTPIFDIIGLFWFAVKATVIGLVAIGVTLAIVILSSCSTPDDEPLEIKCPHTFTYNEDQKRIELRIESELSSVDICIAQSGREDDKHCWTSTIDYYDCISMTAADVELIIEVWAEGYCREIVNGK